ncbi:MAG TPA: hypothetical protein VF245_06970 [Solirubrobacterales bacterium]
MPERQSYIAAVCDRGCRTGNLGTDTDGRFSAALRQATRERRVRRVDRDRFVPG